MVSDLNSTYHQAYSILATHFLYEIARNAVLISIFLGTYINDSQSIFGFSQQQYIFATLQTFFSSHAYMYVCNDASIGIVISSKTVRNIAQGIVCKKYNIKQGVYSWCVIFLFVQKKAVYFSFESKLRKKPKCKLKGRDFSNVCKGRALGYIFFVTIIYQNSTISYCQLL